MRLCCLFWKKNLLIFVKLLNQIRNQVVSNSVMELRAKCTFPDETARLLSGVHVQFECFYLKKKSPYSKYTFTVSRCRCICSYRCTNMLYIFWPPVFRCQREMLKNPLLVGHTVSVPMEIELYAGVLPIAKFPRIPAVLVGKALVISKVCDSL